MIDWAEKEVALAIERDKEGRRCYESALKAFKCLLGDGHSGSSIYFTKAILNRLIDGGALTPVEGKDEEWEFAFADSRGKAYQNKRMSSLFKYVNGDDVRYSDVHRVIAVDENGREWHSKIADDVIDEMFPIELPYSPAGCFKVYVTEFLSDPKNGDFDTVGVLRVRDNKGEDIPLKRIYFGEKEGKFKRIGTIEYLWRKILARWKKV